jgi:hypothetical protein
MEALANSSGYFRNPEQGGPKTLRFDLEIVRFIRVRLVDHQATGRGAILRANNPDSKA